MSCGTLLCMLSVGNSFKTSIISVDLGRRYKIVPVQGIHSNFKRVAKPIDDILRYHKKVVIHLIF